jgi:hypothetical protein
VQQQVLSLQHHSSSYNNRQVLLKSRIGSMPHKCFAPQPLLVHW